MHKHLGNELAPKVKVLYFIRSHILSLRQLEDVLSSVNEFEREGLGVDFNNVTCFQPAIRSYGLFGQLLLFVIAHEDIAAS